MFDRLLWRSYLFAKYIKETEFLGVGLPRALAVSGRPLPSPRAISANVHPDISRPHTRYSLIVMQMAQLTDHDLTFTPVYAGSYHTNKELPMIATQPYMSFYIFFFFFFASLICHFNYFFP